MAQNEFAISKKMIILLIFKFEVYFTLITAIINLLFENIHKLGNLKEKSIKYFLQIKNLYYL